MIGLSRVEGIDEGLTQTGKIKICEWRKIMS
jgi:hypothetical protein